MKKCIKALAAFFLLGMAAGCGGGGGSTPSPSPNNDAEMIEAVLNGRCSAFVSGDINAYISYYSTTFSNAWFSDRSELQAAVASALLDYENFTSCVSEISDLSINGNTASAKDTYTGTFNTSDPYYTWNNFKETQRVSFKKTGNSWLINAYDDLTFSAPVIFSVTAPAGGATVDVSSPLSLAWTAYPDADTNPDLRYLVRVWKAPNYDYAYGSSVGNNVTSAVIPANSLQAGSHYYINILLIDNSNGTYYADSGVNIVGQ